MSSLDGAPSGLTFLWLLLLLESLWMIFAAYCYDLAKCEHAVKLPAGRMHFSVSALVTAWKSHSSVPLPFFLLGRKKKNPCLTQAYVEAVTAACLWFDLNGSKAGCEGKSKAILVSRFGSLLSSAELGIAGAF